MFARPHRPFDCLGAHCARRAPSAARWPGCLRQWPCDRNTRRSRFLFPEAAIVAADPAFACRRRVADAFTSSRLPFSAKDPIAHMDEYDELLR
ncbi:GntR family transcriptional regulator [Burkholderia pseudomallei]|nr:GntR family transcriptional regulator [Burkholderia pseudomallei]